MRIATLANGGIGGFLAVHLTQAGHEAASIARGPHLQAIRGSGLTLKTDAGATTVRPRMATESITGAVVRLSDATSLDAPVNRTLLAVLSRHLGGNC